MSNIFLKNDFDGIFNSASESNVPLPKWINIVDIASNQNSSLTSSASGQLGGKYSATSSASGQLGGKYSATSEQNNSMTSSASVQLGGKYSATSEQNNTMTSSASVQLGGKYSATSNVSSTKDVNKLISMLTSDSSSLKLNNASETSTVSLENQLREILEKEGGGKKKKSKSQKGGSEDISIENIKNFFTTLKSQGVNVDIKLNNKTMTDFFGGAENTTTEIPNQRNLIGSETSSLVPQNYLGSETSSVVPKNYLGSETSSAVPQNNTVSETSDSILVGGAKKGKKSSKKASKKASKKSSKKMDGGINPGFQAFLDLKKHVATKLGISNGPKAAKVAGAVQKEMKEKHPDLDAVKIAEEGRKHFDKNVDHFKQMLN